MNSATRRPAGRGCWAHPSLLLSILWLLTMEAGYADAASDWSAIVQKARGQKVYWNAWGGDDRVNAYIQWASRAVEKQFGIRVYQVKVTDTAEAVTRVVAEKAAGKHSNGSVDLIWINGENFAAMKEHRLLYGPITQMLPNFRLVDTLTKPTLTDFTVPVEGLEAPWSMAQFVFLYDSARVSDPPRTPAQLLEWARAHPGRFTYPQPPDFLGTTFLKQLLMSQESRAEVLDTSVSEAQFKSVTKPLWQYLQSLHPLLWRKGGAFPANGPAQIRVLGDGELDIALAFGPEAASSAILSGQLPGTVRAFTLAGGSIANASFLAIPYNSGAKEAALVLINFLLSPAAQAHKQDPHVWGSMTVLDLQKLSTEDRSRFEQLPRGPAALAPDVLGQPLPEPHPSWMLRLEQEWQKQFGSGG